ncbi:MAG: hypothetical protein R6W70_09275 [bacterium]
MKRFLILFVICAIFFSLISCGEGAVTEEEAYDDSEQFDDSDNETDNENDKDTENDDIKDDEKDDDGDDSEDHGDENDEDEDDKENDTDDNEEENDDDSENLEITGRWTDSYGGMHHISKERWHQGWGVFTIEEYNNSDRYVIAVAEEALGGAYNRFDWTEEEGQLFFCNIEYEAQSIEEALENENSDPNDLESGCNDFSWSALNERRFSPQADHEESDAVSKDSESITAWASGYVEPVSYGSNLDEEWKTPEKALGPASGESSDVVSLGRGGEIIMTFETPVSHMEEIADFAVFSNSFNHTNLELAFVSVSSNGTDFIMFENEYLGDEAIGPYDGHNAELIRNLAGKYKQGYGTPFNLGELENRTEVVDGTVDIYAITHIKITDIIGDGSVEDSFGYFIYDPFPTEGSAGFDLDGIAVINEDDMD